MTPGDIARIVDPCRSFETESSATPLLNRQKFAWPFLLFTKVLWEANLFLAPGKTA
jgi:hypothetical protein